MTKVITYVREEEKKHSVRYVEEGSDPRGLDQTLGTIYVHRRSGLTDAPRLRLTIEVLEAV